MDKLKLYTPISLKERRKGAMCFLKKSFSLTVLKHIDEKETFYDSHAYDPTVNYNFKPYQFSTIPKKYEHFKTHVRNP